MRLIDADKFYEDLVKEYPQVVNGFGSKINAFTDNVKERLDECDVAYDIDKVIGQLENIIYNVNGWETIDFKNAIDIVKKGGIE